MTSTAALVEAQLRARGFREEGRGKWRGNSPLRPGSDSNAFVVIIEGPEHGAYTDHAREGESGSLYELATALGIEVSANGNSRKQAQQTKRAYNGLADYAKAHGVTSEVLEAARWKQVTHQGRPALEFPTATGRRWRFLDGEKPSYISEQGYKKCWYGLDRAVEQARKYDYPLIICNGEISTVVATHYGLPACAVTSGEGGIPDDLLRELKKKWTGDIIIALDCDEKGRDAARRIAAQLVDRPHCIVDLGLTDGGDLADFCMLHGDAAAGALESIGTDFNHPPKDILTAAAVADLTTAMRQLQTTMAQDERTRQAMDLDAAVSAASAALERVTMQSGGAKSLTAAQVVERARERFIDRLKNPGGMIGLSSGIPDVDKMINSFIGGRLYTVLGATGMGKSTLTASFVGGGLLQSGPGMVAATETQSVDWMDKLVAYLTSISFDRIQSASVNEAEAGRVLATYDRLEKSCINFVDIPQPTPLQLRNEAHGTRNLFGRIAWAVVDSASKMTAPGMSDIYNRMVAVFDGLHAIAQDFDMPVIATSQVGRDLAERPTGKKRPRLDDAYGGSAAEQNSDVVFGLYRHDYYVKLDLEPMSDFLPEGAALLTVLKNRWGDGGDVATRLQFRGGCGYYAAEFRKIDLGG